MNQARCKARDRPAARFLGTNENKRFESANTVATHLPDRPETKAFHLEEKQPLELSGKAGHAHGARREKLTREATRSIFAIASGIHPCRLRAMDAITTKEERTWATVAHLSAFAIYFSGVGHIVGPLVIWLIKKDSMPFVDDQGKEALNFQISWTIYLVATFVLFFTLIGAIVAIPLFFILPIFHIVCMIVAAFRAYDGTLYRYPLTIRFLH